MSYTTSVLIGNYLQRTLSADETSFLVLLIPAVEAWIDAYLGTTFASGVSEERYFDGGYRSLDIDPCVNITNVVAVDNDQSDSYDYTDLTEYIAMPANSDVKTELVKRNGKFPLGTANIQVTATFSEYDGGVPSDIQLVATIMAGEVLNQGSLGSSGAVSSESVEGHSVSYDTSSGALDGISASNPNVMGILAQRRQLFVG